MSVYSIFDLFKLFTSVWIELKKEPYFSKIQQTGWLKSNFLIQNTYDFISRNKL